MTNHPNRTTAYTILDHDGAVQSAGETLSGAAHIVLSHDGHEYEIRSNKDGDGFDLWTSPFSRNSPCWRGLTRSTIFSLNVDEALATADIFRQVIRNADWWGHQRVVTDADYVNELAEIAAQE